LNKRNQKYSKIVAIYREDNQKIFCIHSTLGKELCHEKWRVYTEAIRRKNQSNIFIYFCLKAVDFAEKYENIKKYHTVQKR